LLNQDCYFRDFQEIPEDSREEALTSNHPRAVLWDDLVSHLETLKSGRTVTVPATGTRARLRGDEPKDLGPSELVIVEGHLLFNKERILGLADLLVFVDANSHERAVRRLLRDTESGKTTLERAGWWYRKDVIPNVETYSEARRDLADVIVPFDRDNEVAAQAVADWVGQKLDT
jgi:uridine kinase